MPETDEPTYLPLPPGCTGYWALLLGERTAQIQHDGDSCPVHEPDEPDEEERRPCGCYFDYHSADCPHLTDRYGSDDPPGGDWDDRDSPDYGREYD